MEEELKKEIEELIKESRQQDSIEIGNSKTGSIKVYFNAENKEEAEKKIITAIELLLKNRDKILKNKKAEQNGGRVDVDIIATGKTKRWMNMRNLINLDKLKIKCERCDYKWIPRKEDVRVCPKCKSAYWDVPKKKWITW